MKRVKKKNAVICLLLSGLMTLGALSACKGNTGNSSGNQTNVEGMTDIGKIEKTDKVIATNGATSYKILLPDEVSSDLLTASNELRLFLSEATNAQFDVATEYVEGEKYFSLGDTELAQEASIECDYTELGLSGYKIKTVGDSVCIAGYTDTAVIYGVYEYLERMLDFDYYFNDTYSLEKVSTLYLYDFDCVDVPDFDVRVAGLKYISKEASQITKRRMRLELYQNTFVSPLNVGCWHNSMAVMPPQQYFDAHRDWYNEQFTWKNKEEGTFDDYTAQICYSAHGNETELTALLETLADVIFNYFQQFPNTVEFAFNMQDNDSECDCDACLTDETKYGARSATLIKFFNRLAGLIEQKFMDAGDKRYETFKLSFYAYHKYRQAPVEKIVGKNGKVSYKYEAEMKLNKHISPMYANSYINLTEAHDSQNNIDPYDTLDKWRQIAPHIHIWIYDVYFRSEGYMVYFDSLNRYQEHLRKFKEAEADWIMSEQEGPTPTAFIMLRGYVLAKLMWNIDEDISVLVDKYFKAMYGSQADTVKQVFVEMKTLVARNNQELGMTNLTTRGYDFTSNPAWWPKALLADWNDKLKAADAALRQSGEEQAAQHVRIERISPLYMLLEMHRLTYSESVYQSYKAELKSLFDEFGYTELSQELKIDEAFAKWG